MERSGITATKGPIVSRSSAVVLAIALQAALVQQQGRALERLTEAHHVSDDGRTSGDGTSLCQRFGCGGGRVERGGDATGKEVGRPS